MSPRNSITPAARSFIDFKKSENKNINRKKLYEPIKDLQNAQIQNMCKDLGITNIESERKMLVQFIEYRLSQIQEDRSNLQYSQEKFIEFDTELKNKMSEKMDIYSKQRSNNSFIKNTLDLVISNSENVEQNP